MRINTNMAALNAWRNMSTNEGNVQKSLEKLSSGFRINRAADDAAGLAVSEKMRAQIRGTNMAVRNAQDGISMVQTAEGALTETHNILQRMRELAVQASTGTLNSDDSQSVQAEVATLKSEIDRIGQATKFNGQTLLDGKLGNKLNTATIGTNLTAANGVQGIMVGANAKVANNWTVTVAQNANGTDWDLTVNNGTTNQTVTINPVAVNQQKDVSFDKLGVSLRVDSNLAAINANNTFDVTAGAGVDIQVGAINSATERINIKVNDMTTTGLGINGIDVSTTTTAQNAITSLDTAIGLVSTQRANLGATQNRLEHTVSNLQVTSENLSAAESRIRDVDMASEMANFTKNNILMQASQAMLAQANQSTQGILSLLR